MLTRKEVGEALRSIRKAKGLNLEEVALPAGTDAGSLSKIERGLQGFSDESLGRIADVLETRLSQIYLLAEEIARYGPPKPDTISLAQRIDSLPPDSQVVLQKVANSFVKSTATWDGLERRRGEKEGKG